MEVGCPRHPEASTIVDGDHSMAAKSETGNHHTELRVKYEIDWRENA